MPFEASVILILYLIAELAFHAWFRLQLWQAHRSLSPSINVPLTIREYHINKVIALVKRHGSQVLSGWFVDPATSAPFPCGRVCGDLKEFLSWAFWNQVFSELCAADQAWVGEGVRRIVKETGIDYIPELGGRLLRNNSDPLVIRARPLALYLLVSLIKLLTGAFLLCLGFRPGERYGVQFWHRKGGCRTLEPIVFFHGISPGLVAYVDLLPRLRGEVIIIELPWIAMSTGALPPREPSAYADKLLALFDSLGLDQSRRLVLCGHSYGSFVISWLLRRAPTLNCRLVLVDPVTLYLVVPKVCYAFLYKRPEDAFETIVRLWAAEEIGVARAMRRHFNWLDCVQYADELPAYSQVFLSEKDHIVPVEIVHAECMDSKHVRVKVFPQVGHGGPLIHRPYVRDVVDALLVPLDG